MLMMAHLFRAKRAYYSAPPPLSALRVESRNIDAEGDAAIIQLSAIFLATGEISRWSRVVMPLISAACAILLLSKHDADAWRFSLPPRRAFMPGGCRFL